MRPDGAFERLNVLGGMPSNQQMLKTLERSKVNMRNGNLEVVKNKVVNAIGCVALGLAFLAPANLAKAQTVSLPPGVQDVVKLSQAGVSEDVILTQVRGAGAYYNLSADQIIYLTKSGVTQNVIKALVTPNSAPAPTVPVAPVAPVTSVPPPPTAPPAPVVAPLPPTAAPGVSFDSFHDQLSPYGSWVQVAGYGWCWRPSQASFDPAWQPYGSGGHWIYTDAGWSWESDYPWGGIAFHYGRWMRDPVGWIWVPGYDYAPAWVTWRHSDGVIGWAPLPPAAVFRAGVGIEFGGHVGVDLDFGLAPSAFVFVGYDHFWDHELHGYFVPHDRVDFYFHHSVIMNGYRFDHGRFFVEGIGRERIAGFTHHDVRIEVARHDFHREPFHDPHRVVGHDDHRGGHDHDR